MVYEDRLQDPSHSELSSAARRVRRPRQNELLFLAVGRAETGEVEERIPELILSNVSCLLASEGQPFSSL